jgi:hypothetical protein
VHVLDQMVEAVNPGGLVLDLQVIRPNPIVEADGAFVCEIDGEPLFHKADAATAAIDALIDTGRMVEQAVDDHDVRGHYEDGADLIAAFTDKRRQLPADMLPALRVLARPCVVRERCRLRRLRVH